MVAALQDATGRRFCANRPYSGTEVLDAYGPHHLQTGELILYTSADSVLQIAAHIDVLDEPGLYAVCEAARALMTGADAVGRVIARPFDGEPGAFHRREGRRDYAVPPPGRSYLQELQDAGVPVHAVGKIRDLFAGVGIDVKHTAATNQSGIAATTELVPASTPGWRSRTSSRPTSSTATATTSRASITRCRRSTLPWGSGWACCARATCSS